MEKKHIRRLREKFGPMINGAKKVICLDIPDEYTFMDEELIEILRSSVSNYIEIP